MDSVDIIYEQPILERFWRVGELVANDRQPHPYRVDLLDEFSNDQCWFMLGADVNPEIILRGTNGGADEIKVVPIARVLGEPGSREWLLYAHSPLVDRSDVNITIPGYGNLIAVDVPIAGGFWHIEEATSRVHDLQTGETFYVPEPGAAALLVLGAIGLLGRKRTNSQCASNRA